MDRDDPNTWTKDFVLAHRADCLRFLQTTNSQVIDYVRRKNYVTAVAGLDRIQNGLITMNNAKCGDFFSHLAMFSLCEASIIAFGIPDSVMHEDMRRERALLLFQDARDFSKSADVKNLMSAIIADLESGTPLTEINKEYDPDFPQSVIETLTKLNSRLSSIPAPRSSGSGGCYLTTACVVAKNLPDDCVELQTLRSFRDGYLSGTEAGKRDIEQYYRTAPKLVEALDRLSDREQIYDRIYAELVSPCVALIQAQKNEEAYRLYRDYTLSLYQAHHIQ